VSPFDRRSFLKRSAAAIGGAGVGGFGVLAGAEAQSAGAEDGVPPTAKGAYTPGLNEREPFDGLHQAGILTAAPAQATFAALDSLAPDKQTLTDAMLALTKRARELTQGGTSPLLAFDDPSLDSGTLGPDVAPDALTITVGFGASLFDDRYGLASLRPRELITMPTFATDQLDEAQSHGDLMVQICANQRDTVTHALRELLRTVRGTFQLRWSIDGFSSARRGPEEKSSPRNLFAFRDGTANPSTSDAALMDKLVWASSAEPSWAQGGTYQVVRIIRMHVEFWDRVGLREQQNMIGRERDSGAPIGGKNEFDDPRFDLDPKGERIGLDAHIRLANPRTPKTEDERMVRRGFNFARGVDEAGALDQGLVFVAFNQDPARQFATVQKRLVEEPMIDYITPVGGGYFFVPPGSKGEFHPLGDGLL
jgi:deferrochelatase/peroxidase EfeB